MSWLNGIKSNAGGHLYPDNETIADEVNRGAVAFGVVNQYYWYRMKAELGASNIHSKITYFAPGNPGYVLDVSGAAVLKSSKNQAAAQRFVAFLVSKQGQEVIAHSTSFEYPLDDGVTTVAPETPFGELQPNSITVAQLGDGSTAVGAPESGWLVVTVAAAEVASPRKFHSRRRRGRARSTGLFLVSLLVALVLLLPLAFLVVEAQGAGVHTVASLIDRPLTLHLLWNTVRLAVVVTALCAVLGTGTAWLVERTDLPGRRIWAVLLVVPLAIPTSSRASAGPRSAPPSPGTGWCWS